MHFSDNQPLGISALVNRATVNMGVQTSEAVSSFPLGFISRLHSQMVLLLLISSGSSPGLVHTVCHTQVPSFSTLSQLLYCLLSNSYFSVGSFLKMLLRITSIALLVQLHPSLFVGNPLLPSSIQLSGLLTVCLQQGESFTRMRFC